MIAAEKLVDEYFEQLAVEHPEARRGRDWGSDRAITVLRYSKGKLYFATNTDQVRGYREVNEETVTAFVDPGEYIFWYCGGGLSELVEIEFDQPSQAILVDFPEEIKVNKLWAVTVVPDDDMSGEQLKYDIIYQIRKNRGGDPIRLDPKIEIK